MLVLVHQELNQHDSAIDSYKKAIAINPKYPDAHNNLGIVYLDSKDLDNAVVHFEYAINFSDNFAEAHNNLGSTFQQKGLLEKALNSYKKSITLKPDYAQAHNNMGILLQKIGNNKAAILSYEKALDSDPSYALAHHNLSALKIYSEDDVHITQMKSSLSSSNISQSDRVHLYFTLAKVSEDLGDNDMLFEYLNEGNQLRKNALNFSFENYNLVIQNLFNC